MSEHEREGCLIDPHEELNAFLVDVFHHILRAQARELKKMGYRDLSVNETHVIESACLLSQEGRNSARGIAQALDVTPGTLTVSINALEKKGYLRRSPDPTDRRRVRVSPTERGLRAERDHRLIHDRMVESIAALLDEQEMQALLSALKSISAFFTSERTQSP